MYSRVRVGDPLYRRTTVWYDGGLCKTFWTPHKITELSEKRMIIDGDTYCRRTGRCHGTTRVVRRIWDTRHCAEDRTSCELQEYNEFINSVDVEHIS